MAGGPSRRKASRPRTSRASHPKPRALRKDRFGRGAARRAPTAAATTVAAPTASPATAATATPIATPTPTPIAVAPPHPGPLSPLASGERETGEPGAVSAARAAAARLARIEHRLDDTIDGLEARIHGVAQRLGIAGAESELREAMARLLPAVKARLATALDVVRLLEPPERLDRYGMDRRFAQRLEPLIEILCSSWWRVDVRDASRVPAAGPAIVVANHAGVVPWDALVLRHALRRDHPAHRELRPLLDDRECALPFFGAAAIRAGAVRASPEAAEGLLAAGEVVGVFPEGSAGARKPWRDRYRLLRFGRGGFAKIALRTGAPIVPCAILGSEEASPGLSRPGWLAERLGLPLLAANPSLTLGMAGALPLPSRWSLRFGEPLDVGDRGGADAANDARVVNEIAERVRATLVTMLGEGLAARSSVYL